MGAVRLKPKLINSIYTSRQHKFRETLYYNWQTCDSQWFRLKTWNLLNLHTSVKSNYLFLENDGQLLIERRKVTKMERRKERINLDVLKWYWRCQCGLTLFYMYIQKTRAITNRNMYVTGVIIHTNIS